VPIASALMSPDVAGRPRSFTAVFSGVVAGVSVAVLYVWDDVLLAGPVVAVTALAGPVVAFALFASVYALVSFVLAMAGVRAYERWTRGTPSKFAHWLSRQREARRATWARRLLDSGKVAGFVASSFLLGGIMTTFLIRYGGRRDGIERIALLSSVIFGVTFTAAYAGLGQALFAI
jgi:hypothetical protein